MPDERNPADAELLEAFRAGDVKAFEVLVRRYERPVLAIARRFAADQDDAEDLAQRAFINAAGRAHGWRGGSFKSWLFRIVVNLAKNYVRDTSRFDRSVEAQEREAPAVEPIAHASIEAEEERAELRDMADKDGGAEARCDFCATTYRLTRDELLDLARAV